jgi:hypothetical protein
MVPIVGIMNFISAHVVIMGADFEKKKQNNIYKEKNRCRSINKWPTGKNQITTD